MADPNLSQLVATTLRNRRAELVDNMSDNVAFYNRLRRQGTMRMEDGGRNITQPLEYSENTQFQWYSGYETLNIGVNDFISAAEFDWKQASVPVSISGLEELRNSGKHAVIKLLKSKIENARRTFVNQMGVAVYADGSGSGSKEIGGLGLLVPTTVTNTVGGISANTWGFWRSQKLDASDTVGAAADETNIQEAMRQAWVQTCRNNDKVDLILADNNYYNHYWGSLASIQRITGTDQGQAGFASLKFVTADVVLDGGLGYASDPTSAAGAQTGHVDTNTMFFLNTKYLQFCTHRSRNIEIVGGERMSVNQDAMTQLMLWAGNMTVSNRALQLKMVA